MFVSLVITITPIETVTLSSRTGPDVHGWFLKEMQKLDATLSTALHRPNEQRPFTVSDLWQGESLPQRVHRFIAGEVYWFRVTSVESTLTRILLEDWLPNIPPCLEINRGKFVRQNVYLETTEHPWAGWYSTDMLHSQRVNKAGKIALEFVSPTLFRSEKKLLPFPLPHLVFGGPNGLANRWRQWVAPDTEGLTVAIDEYIAQNIAIESYDLHTVPGRSRMNGEAKEGGFVGHCVYKLMGQDREIQQRIYQLGTFAFFAGVGKHCAMGFGQARMKPGE